MRVDFIKISMLESPIRELVMRESVTLEALARTIRGPAREPVHCSEGKGGVGIPRLWGVFPATRKFGEEGKEEL